MAEVVAMPRRKGRSRPPATAAEWTEDWWKDRLRPAIDAALDAARDAGLREGACSVRLELISDAAVSTGSTMALDLLSLSELRQAVVLLNRSCWLTSAGEAVRLEAAYALFLPNWDAPDLPKRFDFDLRQAAAGKFLFLRSEPEGGPRKNRR